MNMDEQLQPIIGCRTRRLGRTFGAEFRLHAQPANEAKMKGFVSDGLACDKREKIHSYSILGTTM